MTENKKQGRTGDKELSSKIDEIIVSNNCFFTSILNNIIHSCPLLLQAKFTYSSMEVGIRGMNFLENGLSTEVTCARFRLEYFCLLFEVLSPL